MREIIFRGKRLDNGEWVYGNLKRDTYDKNDFETGEAFDIDGHPVDETTIGQFSGLFDVELAPIFEGDIVEWTSNYRGIKSKHKRKNPKKTVCEVVWSNAGLRLRTADFPDAPWNCRLLKRERHYNVLGNIHDNPELLNTPKQ